MELAIDRLTKRFGGKTAVDCVSASLTAGVYGLLGANGAGKTTLMRMLCAILKPTAGEVRFNGREAAAMGETYRDVLGYLPQDFGYYPTYTAAEFLSYIAALKGIPRDRAAGRVRELVDMLGLQELAGRKLRTFSGGMRQRVGIAQAMLNDPQVLILDEPMAGLDPKERVRLRNLLAEYAGDKIVVLSTHIVSDVEAIVDQVFVMNAGRFAVHGTVPELARRVGGKVWEITVPRAQARQWQERTLVASYRHEGEQAVLRVIAEERPSEGAVPCEPTLDDAYLYSFGASEAER